MLKYIFALVFIGLFWAVALVYPEIFPLWAAILATALVVAGVGGFVLWKFLRAKKASSELERALDEQAKGGGGGMRPDQQADIAAMSAEFNKAVAALKTSKLGKGGAGALNVLPWYVIIGPPGAGKTTALRNSGLKFPYAARASVRGVGGTRNCDWWLTNEAILLDTAGRWSTEDDDRDEWLAFLDLLRKTRPHKPLNGILVAVSTTELQGDEEEIEALARKLRERIDEVMGRLDMVIPVYLLVTKCDLIPGFIETFGGMRDKERGQIWGATLPLLAETGERAEIFVEKLDELIDIVDKRTLQRLGEERGLDARPKVYEFPQQFAALRQNLVDLCTHLFAENAYQDTPIMRGVYFTSGTQEGRPIDRVMSKMAEAFGARPRVAAAMNAPVKPKSYFVRDLFTRVVIPDRDVAVRSTRVLRKQRILRWGLTAGALAVAVAFLFLPVSSYLENRKLIAEASTFVERLARAKDAGKDTAAGPLAASTLEAIEPMVTRLAKFETSGPDVSMRFGLYLGDKLLEPLDTAVDRLVLRPLLDADADRLTGFLRGQGGGADEALDALTFHLLMTQPKGAEEPQPGSDNWSGKWEKTTVELAASRWEKLAAEKSTTKAKKAIESAARFVLARVEDPTLMADRRGPLVARARASLAGGDGDPLGDILKDPSMPRDLRLEEMAGGAVTAFRAGSDGKSAAFVPGAFTADGFKAVHKRLELLTQEGNVDENAWVLGERKTKPKDIDPDAILAAYFRKYIDAWKNFFLSVGLKEPTTVEEARDLYKALLLDKPLDAIWRSAAPHLELRDDGLLALASRRATSVLNKKVADKKKAALGSQPPGATRDERPPEPFEPKFVAFEFQQFRNFGVSAGNPTPLDTYGQIIAELQAALGETGTPDGKTFQAVLRAQRAKLRDLVSRNNRRGWEAGILDRLLQPPLRGAEVAVVGASGESANRKWCESVVVAFDSMLKGRYPFVTGKGVRNAAVADVEKFFMPNAGILWQYFNESLKADIDHPAGTSIFRLRDEASIKYRSSLTDFLKRAQRITDLFFKDPTKIGFNYAIRIRASAPYTKIIFESGKRITYINTKERWEDLTWPARGAAFQLVDRMGTTDLGFRDLEWGLFTLLESAKLEKSTDVEDFLKATWPAPVGDAKVNADFKPVWLGEKPFRNFEMPRAIVSGAKPCGD